ncbi:YigZ family protein [Salinibacterium sp. dk2585]|uniref:YigZ family protein n=1 Tax=unclassified Salinibacterium TaxID=2632331 RepID=UPI0011C2509F|nr:MULTISPECIES: YigZ family protein [unclassified Salinibacterium]QEE61812.1 YigZ family protein [Salinibacterium sp. dk2585]TXK54633.1 YigZ family protein [Salinibacterium sp. dk5596]
MTDVTLRGGPGAAIAAEVEVKRSRFICRIERVETEDAARAVVDAARREHWGARHHCSAFVIGPKGAAVQVRRSSDDGEPSGTAGAPMLDTLAGAGLVDVVAVVTRYFGGVLLGTGGLARAYSDAVANAIREAALVARERRELFRLSLHHADAGRVESELRARGVTVLDVEYAARAELRLSGGEGLHEIVAAATSGAGALQPLGHEWVDVELNSVRR